MEVSLNNNQYESKVSKVSKEIYEWADALVSALIILTSLLTFVFIKFSVNGTSMLPTLHHEDRVLACHLLYTPKKGDIITIDEDKTLGKNIIKRIIATPGDSIKINYESGEVYVNGQLLEEPYINTPTNLKADWDIPEVIPEGNVFAMGDNRNGSKDSRSKEVKLVKFEQITGRALLIYYPFNRIKFL